MYTVVSRFELTLILKHVQFNVQDVSRFELTLILKHVHSTGCRFDLSLILKHINCARCFNVHCNYKGKLKHKQIVMQPIPIYMGPFMYMYCTTVI